VETGSSGRAIALERAAMELEFIAQLGVELVATEPVNESVQTIPA
jgi:hypothetical protein